MKTVQAKDMTDDQWKLYAELDEELDRKYYQKDLNKKSDWHDLKRNRLIDLKLLSDDYLNFYLFIENGNAVGWLGIRLAGDVAEFVMDVLYEEIPDNVIMIVFEIAKQFMSERNKEEIYTYTSRKGIIDSLTKAGGIIFDRKIFVRLKREEIDIEGLRRTADSISEKINYKLILYDTIHEEILDRYVQIYNEARIDMNQFNPNKPLILKRTKETC